MPYAFTRIIDHVGDALRTLGATEYRVTRQGILLVCPSCGQSFTIRNENVNKASGVASDAPDGDSKKVQCPHDACTFNAEVTLADVVVEDADERIIAAGGGMDAAVFTTP